MRPGISPTGTIARRIASTLALLAATVLLSVLLAHSTLARTPSNPSPVTTYQATASPTMCNPTWTVIPGQNVGPNDNTLSAIAAIAPDDVWAVGYYSDTGRYKTLTQHWDGSAWSVVPSPNPGSYNNILRGVAASASNDVWAVGDYNFTPAHPTRHLLTMRWDGAQWNVVPNPDPGGNYDNALNSVKAFSANSAVAVGFYRRYAFLDLRMHWSGAWSESFTPTVYLGNLASVDGRAANDVWAVGTSPNASGYAQPLTEHFDGSTWSVVSSPSLPDNSYLYGVSVVSTNDVWAVGATYVNQNPHSVIEHWDGTAWSIVPAPDVGRLSGVKAIAANDVWAIGSGTFLHWDGAAWTPVPDPAGGRLAGIDALSADNIWAVGTQNVGGVDQDSYRALFRGMRHIYPSPCYLHPGSHGNSPTIFCDPRHAPAHNDYPAHPLPPQLQRRAAGQHLLPLRALPGLPWHRPGLRGWHLPPRQPRHQGPGKQSDRQGRQLA